MSDDARTPVYLMPESATLRLLRGIRLRGTINGVLMLVLLVGFALYAVNQDRQHTTRIGAVEARLDILDARLDNLEAWQISELDFRERWRLDFESWSSRQPESEHAERQAPTPAPSADGSGTGPEAGRP